VDLVAHRALKTPTAVAAFLVDRLARLESLVLELADRVAERSRQHLARHHAHVQHLADHAREAARQHLRHAQTALAQRSRQAAQAPRQHLHHLGQHLESFRYTLPQAARRALGQEEQRLRGRSRTVLRRFVRHHQRKREQVLRQQLTVQRVFELTLKNVELKIAAAETAVLRRENYHLRRLR